MSRYWETIENEGVQIFTAFREKDKTLLNK